MKKKNVSLLGLVGIVLGLTFLISLIVIIIGAVLHWNTPVQFSNGFFGAGAVFIVLGILSVTGGFQQRADFPIVYAESAGAASISARTQRMMEDINQRYGTLILLVATGLLMIFISIGIHRLF